MVADRNRARLRAAARADAEAVADAHDEGVASPLGADRREVAEGTRLSCSRRSPMTGAPWSLTIRAWEGELPAAL
eukprot:2701186-Pyramimonas_sp.AAC.1